MSKRNPVHTALAELFYAAGDCASRGDLTQAFRCVTAAEHLLGHKNAQAASETGAHKHIRLISFGRSKIETIKALRKVYPNVGWPLGLKEGKQIAEAEGAYLPNPAGEPLRFTPTMAGVFSTALENAGATVAVEDAPPEE
jgi:ribosomal protein L7/L12